MNERNYLLYIAEQHKRNSMTDLEKLKLPDEFDTALLGTDYSSQRATYSIEAILEVLMETQKWSYEESVEHFDHNIGCAYLGEQTPLYVWTSAEGIEEYLEKS
tara:strand:+ start:2590 stop:2898 length:309 start_codon:yes stop_codon:yes gene_type:complete